MQQHGLFEGAERRSGGGPVVELPARRGDPPTSRAAAAELVASGRQAEQQAEVARLLELYPGATSAELAEYAQGRLDRYQIARRLPELARAGRVRRGPVRPSYCAQTGRAAVTWWPAEVR